MTYFEVGLLERLQYKQTQTEFLYGPFLTTLFSRALRYFSGSEIGRVKTECVSEKQPF